MSYVAPNRLGQALNYLASAYTYAFVKAERRQVFYSALKLMAERDQYISTETMDVEAILKLAITSMWFYSGTKLIADRVSSGEARFHVKRRTGEKLEDIRNHPFELLLERPNDLMTWDFISSYTCWWYYLLGNAYLFISTARPGEGEPEEIWPLPANSMRPLPQTLRKSQLSGRLVIDYEYLVQGQAHILPGENIIHFRNPNPFDYWNGLSFLSAMLQTLRIDYNAGKYQEEFYGKDNAIPTAVISLPAEMQAGDFEIAKEQIREEFGAKRRSAIVRAGDFDIKVIAQTFQQSDFVNSRKFNQSAIYQVLGVPEGLINGSTSGDSRLATEIAFVRNTVQPLLDRMAAELTLNVAPYYGSNIVIVAPNIIPQDRAMLIQEYNTYGNDRTVNENRVERGLKPLPKVGIEAIDIMLDQVPLRLLPYVTSNVGLTPTLGLDEGSGEYASDEVPESFNEPETPQLGDTPGAISPEQELYLDTGKSAKELGHQAALKSWRKVALKEVREGRDPSLRAFVTMAIPQDQMMTIYTTLRGVRDESSVRNIFSTYIK